MAAAATKRRKTSARRPPAKKPGASAAKRKLAEAPEPKPSKLAGFAARKVLKALVRKAGRSAANAMQSAGERALEGSRAVLRTASDRRLPIQLSIDVAVPASVAWEEWTQSSSLTEGVHLVEELERDGDMLIGRIAGPRGGEWEAEIVDEREQESFAWRSNVGSDCAGLVTFHRLSDRLTRIELDLDVVPTNPAQALWLSLHLAHRRAEAELRRFKAQVEFISPDVYEPDASNSEQTIDSETEE